MYEVLAGSPGLCSKGSVTLVLLLLKYEIDDSVTVTVVLLGEAGRCTRLWPTGKTETD